MANGKAVSGIATFGSPEDGGPPVVNSGSSPSQGAMIAVSRRQIRIKLESAEPGVGLEQVTLITINTEEVFTSGGGWISAYSTSYSYTDESGVLTLVINRNTNWSPGTRFNVLVYVADTLGAE